MTTAAPSNRSILQYSALALPLAFAGLPLYIHAPDFYTRDLGMNIGLIGIILLVIRLFDAIQDPIIGYLSDKHAPQRFAIIAAGAAMLTTGMGAIFYGPQADIPTPAWFALSMILATTGFSIITINLNMIGGFWHDNPNQRTKISAWREAFTLIGLLIAAALPAAIQIFKPADEAFKIVFLIFGILIITAFFLFTRFMRKIPAEHAINKTNSAKGFSFLKIMTGKDKNFFTVCFLAHLAASLPGVMVLFFIEDYLGAANLAGLFLFLYFISGAVLMPIWVKLAKRIGKNKAWLASMLLAITTFIGAYFLQPGDVIAYGIICVLSGMALGADLALPPAIIADRITASKTQTQATQYYALLAFIPKVAIAIASGAAFIILDQTGFIAGTQNSPETLRNLIALYALAPCIIKLIAAALLWHHQKGDQNNENNHERTISNGTYDLP